MSVLPHSVDRSRAIRISLLVAVSVLVALAGFSDAIRELVVRWIKQDEYSHGFLIPVIAVGLLWARRAALIESVGPPSWWGPVVVLIAALMHITGELSAFFLLSQVGFVVALMGIVLGAGGFSLLRVTFIPIVFLLFAIPLPYFIDSVLSFRLQLISSELGVFFIRMFQVPVYLEGNVIDLGPYKLQVVDACSGLRYLYPLLSLGFLAAYLFQAPLWQRTLVVLSAIPITIVMNSFRIAMVGVLVDRWGTAQAEGLLHFFEGWIIFLACGGLLAAEIYLLARIGSGKSFFQVFYLPKVAASVPRVPRAGSLRETPAAACLLLLCAAGLAAFFVSGRTEILPERARFVTFPTNLGPWQGRTSLLEPQIEHALGLEDYILSDYNQSKNGAVNLYVAYYASQRKGTSPHSPIVCIPGGGWHINKFERTSYSNDALKVSLPFNRVVIERGSSKQIVYYWFVQRGRKVANEYWSKWYLFADSVTKNRTDGALVRLTTPVYPTESERDADERLRSFIPELEARLGEYLPPESTPNVKSVLQPPKGNRS
jgi:exosortase D (VPLPA-CTERM-specific)